MKVGRKLAVKLLNASKFALADLPPQAEELAHPLDRAMIGRLAALVAESEESFEDYDYARALQRTEEVFWWYCDNYLELVKGRRYDAAPEVSGPVSRALRISLSVFQRLLAPFLPFVSEEVWSWWQQGSVHRAPWPASAELRAAAAEGGQSEREELALELTAEVLAAVRKAKSQAQRPMRAPVARLLVRDTPERLQALALGADDLRQAGSIERLETEQAEEASVEVELAEEV
jgi:valyl-tRNA synthetase